MNANESLDGIIERHRLTATDLEDSIQALLGENEEEAVQRFLEHTGKLQNPGLCLKRLNLLLASLWSDALGVIAVRRNRPIQPIRHLALSVLNISIDLNCQLSQLSQPPQLSQLF